MERFTFSRHMPRSGYGYGYGNGNGFDLNQPETHVSNFGFPTHKPLKAREARWETGLLEVRSASPERGWAYSILNRVGCWDHYSGTRPSLTSALLAAWC